MQITAPLTMLRDSDKINKNKKLVKEPRHDQTYNIATLITEAIFNIIARDIIDAL